MIVICARVYNERFHRRERTRKQIPSYENLSVFLVHGIILEFTIAVSLSLMYVPEIPKRSLYTHTLKKCARSSEKNAR